jgi:hypothetical protein
MKIEEELNLVTTRPLFRFVILALILAGSNLNRAHAQMPTQTSPQPQSRIVSQIRNEERVTVKGSTSPYLQASVDSGRLPGGKNLGRMLLMLTATPEQDQAADELLTAQHDGSSALYHKWLTPAQYGQQFGATAEDAVKVQHWLEQQGLTVHGIAQSRRFIVFSGTVDQVEQAFSTEMHSYTHNGKSFISNATDVQIPAALLPAVKGVVRLHSDPRAQTTYMGGKVHFNKKTGQFEGGDGGHYLTPADFAKIYNVQPLYDAGITGAGQSIAIVGRSNIDLQNVRDFRNLWGLVANDPQVIVNGDDPGQIGDMTEAMLDVTWSGAVAPQATILFVVSQSNFADGVDISASYIVDNNTAPVMSTSYGSCEASLGTVGNAFYKALWQQAAAQGITSFVSAGDNGGAGCDLPGGGLYASGGLAINGISSTPYNVSVGGSQFDDVANPTAFWAASSDPTTGLSALGYIPEKVWNESSNDPNLGGLWAGSGGVSSIYAKPNWQAAPGVPNDGKRDIPDFSLTAALHDGYIVCLFSSCSYGEYFYVFGGTSASSPAAAGIMALVNQKMGGQPQGLANYVFYKLASTTGVYHDIVSGDNKVPDPTGQSTVGYGAAVGYDLASGLGSFDANALVNNWAAAASTAGSTATLALAKGQTATVVHGSPVALAAAVTCSGAACTAPTGSVSLLASGATTVGLGAGSLTPASPTSKANLSTTVIPGGTYDVTARYGGDGKYYASTSSPVQVTVTPESSKTYLGAIGGGSFTTAPLHVAYGLQVQVGIIVTGNSGAGHPTGQVALLADGQPATTVSFDPGTGNLTPSTLTLNYGETSQQLVAPGVNPIGQSSTISYLQTSPQISAGAHQLQASYPGDPSFDASTSNTYTLTVTKADTLIADFYPIGTPVPNVPVHLAGQIAFQNGGYAPYSGTVTITDLSSGSPVVIGSVPLTVDAFGAYDVPVTFTTGGTHPLVVNYSGDSNTNSSLGKYFLPISANSPPYVTLSANVPGAIAGTPVSLIAQVSSDVRQYVATGKIVFIDGTTAIGSANLDGTGTATLPISTLAAGLHNITASYAGDHVLTSSVSNPIAEMIADYLLQPQPPNLTVKAGQSGTAMINVIPLGGSTQTIQLSCGTVPTNITCSVAQAAVTLDGINPVAVKVTVNANAVTASATRVEPGWAIASPIAFACLLLPFVRRKRLKTLLGIAALLVLGLSGVGCGGSSGTPTTPATPTTPTTPQSATYVVNVNASAGAGTTAKVIPLVVTITN